MPCSALNFDGRKVKQRIATPMTEIAAEMKKPRLIAVIPLRSRARGATAKMPITAVITPIIGTMQREDQSLVAERGLAEDQRGDQHDRVGLEQVRRHAGAVAHVVAHVVGDRGRVARVVLGDALLDLADQVRADVGGLGVDAAADPHEHREQRRAEAEALKHLRRVGPVDQHDDGRAEQAEPDREHARHAAGAERDPHRAALAGLARRRRDADVAAHAQRHAREPGQPGEQGANKEEDATSPAHPVPSDGSSRRSRR